MEEDSEPYEDPAGQGPQELAQPNHSPERKVEIWATRTTRILRSTFDLNRYTWCRVHRRGEGAVRAGQDDTILRGSAWLFCEHEVRVECRDDLPHNTRKAILFVEGAVVHPGTLLRREDGVSLRCLLLDVRLQGKEGVAR